MATISDLEHHMHPPITVAFAGPGAVTPAACKALLNDYLGLGPDDAEGNPTPSERDIDLIFPLTEGHIASGLEHVFAWSEYANLPFTAVISANEKVSEAVKVMTLEANETVEATNVNARVVELLAKARDRDRDAVLVLLWGEGDDGGDEDTEALLDLALAEKLKVIDLTAGLDDMVFIDEEPPPPPEPPVKAARRGRRSKAEMAKSTAEAVVPETSDYPTLNAKRVDAKIDAQREKEKAAEAKPARRGRAHKPEEPLVQEEIPLRAEPEPETQPEVAKSAPTEITEADQDANDVETGRAPIFEQMDLIKGTLSSVYLYLNVSREANSLLQLTECDELPLAVAVREALEVLEGLERTATTKGVAAPLRGRGRPRKDVTDGDEAVTGWFQDGDGIIRVATPGRPRRGEKRVELTTSEVSAKRLAGLVDDQ